MDKSYPVSTPMVVHSPEKKKDILCPREKGKKLLEPEVSYLSTTGALMYLVYVMILYFLLIYCQDIILL